MCVCANQFCLNMLTEYDSLEKQCLPDAMCTR